MEHTGTKVQNSSGEDHRLRRDIGIIGLLFTAVGSIIGSGWLFGALNAAETAGPASILAWAIGAVMIIFIGLCYAELGTMFPVSGGVVRFPHFAFGSFASYTLGWITWLAVASTTSIEVLAALQYSTNYLPWLQQLKDGVPVLTVPGFVVAVALLGLFSLINVIGIRWFARLNNALVWWKLFIIVLVIVMFLVTAFNGANFSHATAGGFMPYGWPGVFSSIATAGIVFSYLGFRQGVELAGETRNPQRNVPIAIIGSVLITGVIYVALQIAFIGSLPDGALVHGWAHIGTSFTGGLDHIAATYGPLAAIATVMGLTWLAVLLYIDAFISPADTGLIYTTVTARISYAMGRNGNAPSALAKVNKHGVPWVSVIVTFVAGVVFLLPFPGWQKLVGFVTSATVLSFGSGPLALVAMRRQLPDQKRPFRLPVVHLLAYLGFLSSNLIVYWSGWDIVWKLMIAVLIGYVVLIIHELRNSETTPNLELRSGFWVPLWLAGLTLISWLGEYPALDKHAGNTGALGFGWATLTVALFSVLIMWVAIHMRLPPERTIEHLNEPAPEQTSALSEPSP
ncbi:APC family permease [Oleiagrimonas sp.]|jgi:amino acid transporter|uniref:APC family permease n=1 Tax=Oleiagrimonas sp. TaxID=2010330 RepID=UPI00261326B2|nr:APC family permease [Oleiagrimonas sp.]MDA3912808.1 APC family permease [Oleiagrimonas sp.]